MMKFNTALKFAGYALIGTCAVEGVYLLWRHWFSRRQGDSASFYDVLFFPDDKIACASEHTQTRGCLNPRCTFSHDPTLSYAKLLKYLMSTHRNLDLCIFMISCRDLADILITLYNRGVCIRLITDRDQTNAMGSQIDRLQAEGIQVRYGQQSYLMHHKFAVVDQWLLINGSFNWTRQAIAGNNENVFITDNASIVTPYSKEFERLWALFNPADTKS